MVIISLLPKMKGNKEKLKKHNTLKLRVINILWIILKRVFT